MRKELAIFSGTYRLNPGLSKIGFDVRHAMTTRVRGFFREVEASIIIGESENFGLDFHAALPRGGLLLLDEVLITIDAFAIRRA